MDVQAEVGEVVEVFAGHEPGSATIGPEFFTTIATGRQELKRS